MPDYRDIYNDVVNSDIRYVQAENSPGFRAVVQATDQLKCISGRSLDIGCGVGFVLQYLSTRTFDLMPFGVDISDAAIEKTKQRLSSIQGSQQRISVLESTKLPFEDDYFSLVTCFDVLEHLDLIDINSIWEEACRVLRPGGMFFGSVSCRKSGIDDKFGDNLHRTVQSVDWWIDLLSPDQVDYDAIKKQLKIWKRAPRVKKVPGN